MLKNWPRTAMRRFERWLSDMTRVAAIVIVAVAVEDKVATTVVLITATAIGPVRHPRKLEDEGFTHPIR